MTDKNICQWKTGADTKNIKLNDLFKISEDDSLLLSGKKSGLVKEPLYCKKGLELSFEQVNEMEDVTHCKESSQKTVSHARNGSVKIKEEPADAPVKVEMSHIVQTAEIKSHQNHGSQASTGMKESNKMIRLAVKNLSDEERKKLRARRFNIIVPESKLNVETPVMKKVPNPVCNTKFCSTNVPTPTYNVLKKRAERFGENVSTVMKSLAYKEKILKRKLKFLGSITNLKELETKKKRIERFRMM